MIIEITATTLKRLENYAAVVQKECAEAELRQWRVMTLAVMQAAAKARIRSREVGAIAAYAAYLFRRQCGENQPGTVYAEPLLSQGLVSLLQELSITPKLVACDFSRSLMAAE
jgi:hypothetical protein